MVTYVHMESQGPWFSPTIRVASILGYRAVEAGVMRLSDLEGQIAGRLTSELAGRAPPTGETIRRWHLTQPGYPEQAVTGGLVRADALPAWAVNFLRLNPPAAEMRQEASRGDDWGSFLFLLLGLLALGQVIQEWQRQAPKSPQTFQAPMQGLRRLNVSPPGRSIAF